MIPALIISLSILAITIQVESVSDLDLKSIFQTPPKRNYDQFGILERSNFDSDRLNSPTTGRVVDKPKSFANAQVLLRFGENKERKCLCGDLCQCRVPPQPYYYPIIPPVPHCYCFPPFLPYYPYHQPHMYPLRNVENTQTTANEAPTEVACPSAKPVNIQKNEVNNVINEVPQIINSNVIQKNVEITNNHPKILNTVNLPEEVIESTCETPNQITNHQLSKADILKKFGPKSVTPNVKFVTVDLSQVPISEQQILVTRPSHSAPQQIEELRIPVQYKRGYRVSSACSYHSSPHETVIHKTPTVLSIIAPPRNPGVKYICVPVNPIPLPRPVPVPRPVPLPHPIDCSCSGCARYVGELNENIL